ncbi:hypothetical protein VTN77DRAFT_4166 [Rasamsonia byssochlamydoides]|uniref:uncharacterized protein n=1 Tax=Rasamsonia byssochlamydoides TaxID=89139 RepID=UPI003744ACFB
MVDYYQVLGVSQDASIKDINSAYKKLALRYHPDKAGEGTSSLTQFRQIQEAIEVLRDPVQRQKHDNYLNFYGRPKFIIPEFKPAENVPDGWPLWDAWYEEDARWRREEEEREREKERRKMEEEKQRELEREAQRQREREMRARRMEAMRARVLRDEEELEQEEEEEEQREIHAEDSVPACIAETLEPDQLADDESSDDSERLETRTEKSEAESHSDFDNSLQNDREDSEEEEQQRVGCNDSASLPTVEASNTRGANPEADLDPLEYLLPFFRYKLADPDHRYDIKDFIAEMTGFILESLQGWFEEQRQGFPGAQPTHVANFANGQNTCRHLGRWKKTFHAEECDVCHLWLPIYTLTCHSCGARACVSCRYQRTS